MAAKPDGRFRDPEAIFQHPDRLPDMIRVTLNFPNMTTDGRAETVNLLDRTLDRQIGPRQGLPAFRFHGSDRVALPRKLTKGVLQKTCRPFMGRMTVPRVRINHERGSMAGEDHQDRRNKFGSFRAFGLAE